MRLGLANILPLICQDLCRYLDEVSQELFV